MGLEIDIEDNGPPIYSGTIKSVRLPDATIANPNGTVEKHPIYINAFPHWIYKVYIEDKSYNVKGADLQEGMPLVFDGKYFLIINVTEMLYHGLEVPTIQGIGYPPNDEKTHKFKRVIDGERQYWEEISDEKTVTN